MRRILALAAACLLATLLLLLTTATAQHLGSAALGSRGRTVLASAAAAAPTKPALIPTMTVTSGHDLYYELPPGRRPRGVVLLLHKCGRSAGDHWPRSRQCPGCLGLPESVSKTKQALARGYAVAAMSSGDRTTGGGGRCWAWADDAEAVAKAVKQLPARLNLGAGAPVYVGGVSSGGSLALRLPLLVAFDGVFGEVIAPQGMAQLLPRMRARFPPALYIHMPSDGGMAAKVAENVRAIRASGLPVGEIKVRPRPLYPAYFSDRSAAVSSGLSALLFAKVKELKLLDRQGFIAVDPKNVVWNAFRSFLKNGVAAELRRLKPAQAEQSPSLLGHHIWECIGLAWGRHETVGEYMTAALIWLEGRGRGNVAALAQKHRVGRPSQL